MSGTQRRMLRTCSSIALACGTAATTAPAQPVLFTVTDLGTLGGASAEAWGVNASGAVAGVSKDALGRDRPFYWSSSTGMLDLGTFGGTSGAAYDLNDVGMVVGAAKSSTNIDRAFMWTAAGGMLPVPGPIATRASFAYGVNNAARVAGSLFSSLGEERSFISDPLLGLIEPSGPTASARAVSPTGQATGYRTSGTSTVAFIWTLGPAPTFGTSDTRAYGINASTECVGEFNLSAFRWTPAGGLVLLPTGPVAAERALGINARGVVVGYARVGSLRHAFMHTAVGGVGDINDLISPDEELEIIEARDINDSGQIVGMAKTGIGEVRAVVLLPTGLFPILYVRADAPLGGNGSSWSAAYRSLQDALTVAAFSDGAVQHIWVAQGVYRPERRTVAGAARSVTFKMVRDVAVYGGFAGTETSLSQRDWAAHPTILSGDLLGNDGPNFANNQENAYHVVTATLTPDDATSLLDGFIITDGNADASNPPTNSRGGGLFCEAGSAVVRNTTFQSNTAASMGGGAHVVGSRAKIQSCRFVSNRAPDGAGIHAEFRALIDRCTIESNQVPAFGGGGALHATGFVIVTRSMIRDNVMTGPGNGAGVALSDQASLINCAIVENLAPSGTAGGVLVATTGMIANCLINGNVAASGAGIRSFGANIINSTITQNVAGTLAGGVLVEGPTSIISSIIWGNAHGGPVGQPAQIGGAPTLSHTTVEGWTGSLGGSGNNGLDPRFIDADGPDNMPGTNDDDLRLLRPLSPAIDSANTDAVPPDIADLDGDSDVMERLPLDLDDLPRLADVPEVSNTGVGLPPVLDRGCYESPVPPCYANCDGSTTPPILNVNDFSCFLNQFAAGDPRANCDASTTPPVLNINDFQCFLNAFSIGCP
ncbi:MAG: GC-type dockerin domain-anchored protein [Phycisphaerales bacterium]